MIVAKEYIDLLTQQKEYTDDQYLDLLVQVFRNIFSSESAAIKNYNLEYVTFSNIFAQQFRLSEWHLGKTDINNYDINKKIAKDIIAQEQVIINEKLTQDTFVHINQSKQHMTYLVRKWPLINPATQNVVGIIIFATQIDILKLRRTLLKLHHSSNTSQQHSVNITKPTLPQQLIITCLLLGFSQQKEIAIVASKMTSNEISQNLVKNTLYALYKKYNCYTTSSLIDRITTNHQLFSLPCISDIEGSEIINQKSPENDPI